MRNQYYTKTLQQNWFYNKIFLQQRGFWHATLKVTLLHGCFSRFLNCAMVPNRTTDHIVFYFLVIMFTLCYLFDQKAGITFTGYFF